LRVSSLKGGGRRGREKVKIIKKGSNKNMGGRVQTTKRGNIFGKREPKLEFLLSHNLTVVNKKL
jgi:hypothetical protein